MLRHFFQLGYLQAWQEMGLTKQAWVAPVAGGLLGAWAGSKLLPAHGAEDSLTNPILGALIGAGLGEAGRASYRAFQHSAAPTIALEDLASHENFMDELRAATERVRAAEAAKNPS